MEKKIDVSTVQRRKGFFGHPHGLMTLFMTELWERFSYYGMRALLILFMTTPVASGGLGFGVAKAAALYGLYTSLVYLLSLPGGWLADRILGQKGAVLCGGVLIAMGNLGLALPHLACFYLGLLLVVMGTGLLKPNISVLVGKLYDLRDSKRDAGFSIFYMGINLGAFLAPLACGYVGQKINWRLGFVVAGAGMVVGLVQFIAGRKYLNGEGERSVRIHDSVRVLKRRVKSWVAVGIAGVALIVVLSWRTSAWIHVDILLLSRTLGVILVLAAGIFFLWPFTASNWTAKERKKIAAIGVLFSASSLFWCVFEQAGSTINLFAMRNVDGRICGMAFPSSWFQSLNGLFIITMAPLFAWIWPRLGSREPSSPAKFAMGLIWAGAGFAVLAGAASTASTGVRVSWLWLVAVYLLHTIGELNLSPVGLSAMTKLAPPRASGLVMGVWFLSLSVGNYLGGQVASVYELMPLPKLFSTLAGTAIGGGILLSLSVKRTRRLMGETV